MRRRLRTFDDGRLAGLMSKVGDLPVRILAEALTLLGMLNEPWVLFGMPFEDQR